MIQFTGERLVPEADNCEPRFAEKMYQEHLARYAFAAQWVMGKRVLDVGCGVGYGSRWLAENGAESILAFDHSSDAIGHAREFYAHPKVTFKVASATNFDFGERFDVVTCFELIEHVDEQQAVIQCIRRALNDDGVLIISTPRALETVRSKYHKREFSEIEFRALLEESFSQVHFYFENNHFSSLITDHKPNRIERVLPLNDQYTAAQTDYFIAVTSLSPNSPVTNGALPVMVIGDDKYVTLLERDVKILHNAEDHLTGKIANLNQAVVERDEQIASLSQAVSERDEQIASLTQAMSECERQIASHAQSNAERDNLRSDFLYLKDLVEQMQASNSWKIMTPYRMIGRRLKMPIRLLSKALEYRRQHGAHALLKAIHRRLNRDKYYVSQLPTSVTQIPTTVALDLPPSEIANKHFDVVFAIGCWEGESKRYRVYNLAEGLTKRGYGVQVMPFERIADLAEHNTKVDIVVLFRAPFDTVSRVDVFLNYAKIRGIKVIFDVDDLVFEPDLIDQIDGVRLLSPAEKERYIEGVHAYRKLLIASDFVTAPTEYLRTRVEAIGRPAFVISNSINDAQFSIAEQLAMEGKKKGGPLRIGYFSGSRTHQADFAECANALYELMLAHPDIVLRIVGYLDLDMRWDIFADRIERIEFQPYQTMLRVLHDCDINIAPLELNSVFCHGKSELKFFEAGLLSIPTIASATDSYVRIIENGVNGFCVKTIGEWREAFEALVDSEELRKSIGGKAKETAIARFGIERVTDQAVEIYGLRSVKLSTTQKGAPAPFPLGRLHIAWVVPGLIIGGGGHRNILRAAYFLTQFGHQVSLYFVGTEQDPQSIKRQIQEHFYPLECPVYLYNGKIHPVDVVFATHWTTVSAALTARGTAREIMYFVQDFEPMFAPMSSEYVLAENTYRLDLYHITSGPWCEMVLRREFGADADHFRFPVDRSIYYPRPRTYSGKRLLFFAKPEMPRRCFELGVMALRHFHRLRPDYEIVMFGSSHASKQKYDFPVSFLDIVPTLEDLAQLYSNADLGMVFSTTNPSLVPYEMMACGLPVVDLRRIGNEVNYGGRFDIALLADPNPENMAEELAALAGNPYELKERSRVGIEFVDAFPTEEGMARRIEELILARLAGVDEPMLAQIS